MTESFSTAPLGLNRHAFLRLIVVMGTIASLLTLALIGTEAHHIVYPRSEIVTLCGPGAMLKSYEPRTGMATCVSTTEALRGLVPQLAFAGVSFVGSLWVLRRPQNY
jgi:hypothetical protein